MWLIGLRQSEIEHLYFAFGRDFHIRRFQIAVNDSFLTVVRRLKCLGDLLCDTERFVHRNRTALDAFGQGFSANEFHHKELPLGGLFESVYRRDVGMI